MRRVTRVVNPVIAAVLVGAMSLGEPSATVARQGKPIIDQGSIRLELTTPTPNLVLCQDQVEPLAVGARETYEYRLPSDPVGTRRPGARDPAALVTVLASSNDPGVAAVSPGSRNLTSPGFAAVHEVTGSGIGTTSVVIRDSLSGASITVTVETVACVIKMTAGSHWTLDLNYPVEASLGRAEVTLRRVSKGRYEADAVLHGLASGDPTLGFDECSTRYLVHETRVRITASLVVLSIRGGVDRQYFDIDLDYDRVKTDIIITCPNAVKPIVQPGDGDGQPQLLILPKVPAFGGIKGSWVFVERHEMSTKLGFQRGITNGVVWTEQVRP